MRTAYRSRRSIAPRSAFAGFRFPSDVIVLAEVLRTGPGDLILYVGRCFSALDLTECNSASPASTSGAAGGQHRGVVVEGRRGTQAIGRSWELVGGHWWHAFGTLVVAWLVIGVVNSLITLPFGEASWFVQGVVATVALRADLQASAA
jgi:hypothetical protein